jgi:hypothetical protein
MKTIEKIVNEYGSKVRQRADNEDRTIDYRKFLYEQNGLYAIDQDLICLKIKNHKNIPVAVLELTRIDNYIWTPSQNYFDSIIYRYCIRDKQRAISVDIAELLRCPVYIVAFSDCIRKFHLYNLTENNGEWIFQNKIEHLEWHYNIRDKEMPYELYEKYKKDLEIEDPFKDIGYNNG